MWQLPDIFSGQPDSYRPSNENEVVVTLSVRAHLKRAGTETKLLIDNQDPKARKNADYSLHRLLARAHQYNAMVMQGGEKSIVKLAAEAGVSAAYFARIFKLSFMSPDIVRAILRDRHPADVTAKRLANETQLPASWYEQRGLLKID